MSILDLGKPKRTNKGLINAYICLDLHSTVTRNIDEGPTPIIISCPHAGCGKPAQSLRYQVNQSLKPHIDWYKPDQVSLLRMKSEFTIPQYNQMLEHVQKGGLLSRLSIKEEPKNQENGKNNS